MLTLLARGKVLGRIDEAGAGSPGSDEQAEPAAGEREEQAFGEQLAYDAALARAQRGANGEFARASRGARQQ